MNSVTEKNLGTDVLAAKAPDDASAIDRVLVLEMVLPLLMMSLKS